MRIVALMVMGASLAGCSGCEDKGTAPASGDIPDPAPLARASDGGAPHAYQKSRIIRPRELRVVQPKQAP